jgi:hypothetical protein
MAHILLKFDYKLGVEVHLFLLNHALGSWLEQFVIPKSKRMML